MSVSLSYPFLTSVTVNENVLSVLLNSCFHSSLSCSILGAVNQNIEQFSSTVEASFCTESDICNGRTIKYKLKGDSVDFHKHAEAEFKKLILKEFSRDEGKLKDTQVWQKRYRLIFSVTITFRTELVLNLKVV